MFPGRASKRNDGYRYLPQRSRVIACHWAHGRRLLGTFKAEQFSAVQNRWIVNPDVRIQITVEVSKTGLPDCVLLFTWLMPILLLLGIAARSCRREPPA